MGRNYALTMPQIRQAAELYGKGLSRRQLAAQFGVSEQAVKNALALAGVRMRERKEAQHFRILKDAAIKPPHYEVGAWTWLHPANADRWQVRQVA